MDLSERGNKAVSDTCSNDDKKEDVDSRNAREEDKYEATETEQEQSITYQDLEYVSSKEISPIPDLSIKSTHPKKSPLSPLKQTSYDRDEASDANDDEEEKIFYRGRGAQKHMQDPQIPKEYRKEKGVDITPDMFKIESSLGRGAFGKVFLVTKKDNGKQYAMKVLSKAEIIKNKITRYAVTEKNVMSKISHPFIVGLNYAFQTDDLLYLILDYCPGGNIGELLDRVNNLNEETAKMYT